MIYEKPQLEELASFATVYGETIGGDTEGLGSMPEKPAARLVIPLTENGEIDDNMIIYPN